MRLRAHTPGGSKLCRIVEHRLDLGERRAELFGDRREIAGEIAGLVDQIDQILPDHAARRIGDRQRELLGEMVGERRLGRDEGFEIVVAVLAAAGAGAGPFGIARRHLGGGARGGRIGLVGKPLSRSVSSRILDGGAAGSPESSPCQSAPPLSAADGAIALVPWSRPPTPPRRRPRRPRCARAADCARARPRHRRRGPDWRAAAA